MSVPTDDECLPRHLVIKEAGVRRSSFRVQRLEALYESSNSRRDVDTDSYYLPLCTICARE